MHRVVVLRLPLSESGGRGGQRNGPSHLSAFELMGQPGKTTVNVAFGPKSQVYRAPLFHQDGAQVVIQLSPFFVRLISPDQPGRRSARTGSESRAQRRTHGRPSHSRDRVIRSAWPREDDTHRGAQTRSRSGRRQSQSERQHGDPAGVIVLHANARAFDLVIVGTHQRVGMGRLRDGSVAKRVIQRVASPVLIVPAVERDAGTVKVPPFGRIVCATDFGPASTAALDMGLPIAQKAGGRLMLVHVINGASSESTARYRLRSRVPEYTVSLHRMPGDACRRQFLCRRVSPVASTPESLPARRRTRSSE